jgi:hypothetical protein
MPEKLKQLQQVLSEIRPGEEVEPGASVEEMPGERAPRSH